MEVRGISNGNKPENTRRKRQECIRVCGIADGRTKIVKNSSSVATGMYSLYNTVTVFRGEVLLSYD